ncbi:hypothetical protein CASFOL_037269 [Castilleja foliolosa]|uniref:Transcription repressor n=1 Tax=Castilleja foliolosa TaxID=1961234 RepID=A0ABD3BNG4_9LAMI
MAKHFKLRIYRVITATLQSCRSKHPSDLPQNPIPSAIASVAACGLPQSKITPYVNNTQSPKLKWQVVAEIYDPPSPRRKICSSSGDDRPFTLLPPPPVESRKRRAKKKKNKKVKHNIPSKHRVSRQSSNERGGAGERDEEENETLVTSPLSFSTNKMRINKRRRPAAAAVDLEIPARLSVFTKLIQCSVDGKVKESFAIVKKSEDPYEDFKDSMMEMILQKQIIARKDLEHLLECFLSLNSRRYHGVIVHAFSEIWEVIFSRSGRVSMLANSV